MCVIMLLLFPAISLPSDPCHFTHQFCGKTSSRPRTPKQNHIETFYFQACLRFHSESPCVFLADLIFISHQNAHSHFATGPQRPPPLSIMRIFTREGAAVSLKNTTRNSGLPHLSLLYIDCRGWFQPLDPPTPICFLLIVTLSCDTVCF